MFIIGPGTAAPAQRPAQRDGWEAVQKMFPPLGEPDFLNADKNRATQTVTSGRQEEAVVNGMKFNNNMPAFPLRDQDTVNILMFVYNSSGNSGLEVTPEEARVLRAQLPEPSEPAAAKSIFE